MKPLIDADVLSRWECFKDGYYISDKGDCWSYWGGLLQGYVGANGYLYYTTRDGARYYAHRLVAQHFLKWSWSEDRDKQVNHKDYNRLNNHHSNLELVSSAENNLHAHQKPNRKKVISYQHPNSKLTGDQAREIFASPLSQRLLAGLYGVSSRTIHDIKHGVKYGWATKEETCT